MDTAEVIDSLPAVVVDAAFGLSEQRRVIADVTERETRLRKQFAAAFAPTHAALARMSAVIAPTKIAVQRARNALATVTQVATERSARLRAGLGSITRRVDRFAEAVWRWHDKRSRQRSAEADMVAGLLAARLRVEQDRDRTTAIVHDQAAAEQSHGRLIDLSAVIRRHGPDVVSRELQAA